MKIEKISSTQIKIFLERDDFEKHDVKPVNNMALSGKTFEFIKEITNKAIKTCEFGSDIRAFSVETINLKNGSLVLIVSKSTEFESLGGDFFSTIPPADSERAFYTKGIEDMPAETSFDKNGFSIYVFDKLDDVTSLCNVLRDNYEGKSTLYKMRGEYYLAISGKAGNYKNSNVDSLVCEYGVRCISNAVSKAYLEEYGDVIAPDRAVEILSVL